MSETEIIFYLALSGILFFWGTILLIKSLICRGKQKRLVGSIKLIVWFIVPPFLGLFAMAAMMDPHGGDPVISTLRLLAILYIVGSLAFIFMEHKQKNDTVSS